MSLNHKMEKAMSDKPKHFDSIISSGVIQALDKYLVDTPINALLETLKTTEPKMVIYGKTVVDEVSQYFIENGVSGRTLQAIRDATFTCFVKGFLLYKTAIKAYDTNKLNEMYNMNYEDYENKMIDAYLASHPNIKSSGTTQ